MRRDSHDPKTVRRLERLLAGRSIDFLLIDGDHSYEGVKRDWELYEPLVTPGGLIAFHDILRHEEQSRGSFPARWTGSGRSSHRITGRSSSPSRNDDRGYGQ